jgi:hypothetical protein
VLNEVNITNPKKPVKKRGKTSARDPEEKERHGK